MQHYSDKELIEQVLNGRQPAYALLLERYQSYVFTLVLKYVPEREQAEELAQDVFIKAYRSLCDFRMESKFSTWLYTITHYTCISWLRKNRPQTTFMEEETLAFIADRQLQTTVDSSELRSRREMIDRAISLLPARDAALIFLFYKAEQTIEETGQILGLPLNNVKVGLHRARQKLKKIMEEKFSRELDDYKHR